MFPPGEQQNARSDEYMYIDTMFKYRAASEPGTRHLPPKKASFLRCGTYVFSVLDNSSLLRIKLDLIQTPNPAHPMCYVVDKHLLT